MPVRSQCSRRHVSEGDNGVSSSLLRDEVCENRPGEPSRAEGLIATSPLNMGMAQPGPHAGAATEVVARSFHAALLDRLQQTHGDALDPPILQACRMAVPRWTPELELAKGLAATGAACHANSALVQLVLGHWPQHLGFALEFPEPVTFWVRGRSLTCVGATRFDFSSEGLHVQGMAGHVTLDGAGPWNMGPCPDWQGGGLGLYLTVEDPDPAAAHHGDSTMAAAALPGIAAALASLQRVAPEYATWIGHVARGIRLAPPTSHAKAQRILPGLLEILPSDAPLPHVEAIVNAATRQYLHMIVLTANVADPQDTGVSFNPAKGRYWTARKALFKAMECMHLVQVLDRYHAQGICTDYVGDALADYLFNIRVECARALAAGRGLSALGVCLWELVQHSIDSRSPGAVLA